MEGVVRIKRFWLKKGGLLRIARTGLFKQKAFVCKNVWCLRTEKKGLCKRKVFGLQNRVAFEDSEERLVQKESFRFVQNGASAFRKVFYKWKRFQFAEKAAFSAHARPTDKEKLFFSTPRQHFSIMPKLTCSCKFHPRKPTVSLQQGFSFSKLCNLASAVR